MAIFSVTYDLNKEKDYKKLWDELERLNGHKAALSYYFIDVNSDSAIVIRDHLLGFVDNDDRLIVCRLDVRPATHRAFQGTKEWLDARF